MNPPTAAVVPLMKSLRLMRFGPDMHASYDDLASSGFPS
jgi:hypothetical protein